MTDYNHPITTCTICGKEIAETITAISILNDPFSRNNQYCKGHEDINPVNRADRRKGR